MSIKQKFNEYIASGDPIISISGEGAEGGGGDETVRDTRRPL